MNERLINEVAYAVVFVQGPGEDLTMTNAEILEAAAETFDGQALLQSFEPDAQISFLQDWRIVELTQPIFPTAPWKGMPKSFYIKKIDAALWRESNSKIYFFQDDQYIRMTGSEMDSGYPRPIAGNWNGLPPEFEADINAAFWRESNGKIYMFKDDQYVRLTETTVDDGYPKPIAGNWHGLPAEFEAGIDAALWRPSNQKTYFFKGGQYVRLTETTVDAGYPKPIADNWHGLPPEFEDGIDAAFWRKSNGKIYMFKGDQYVRLTETTVDAGYPKPIAGNWEGLPTGFQQKIDAAMMRLDTNQIYMFSGRRYVRYSNVSSGIDPGYPNWVDKNWMPFPRG